MTPRDIKSEFSSLLTTLFSYECCSRSEFSSCSRKQIWCYCYCYPSALRWLLSVCIKHLEELAVTTSPRGLAFTWWGCHNCIVPMEFLPWENRVAFPEESQLRQCRATQSTARVGYFRASIIHRTQTWTTGSLTCAQMLMHAIAHGVYGHT